MKQILIITGPQGSGNHVFSKVLALHKSVYGWRELLNEYWIAHDFEPFSECWNTPSLVHSIDWSTGDNYVTSVSCPYANHGEVTIPKYREFVETLEKFGIKVKACPCRKYPGNSEPFKSWNHASRRDSCLWNHDGDFIPNDDPQINSKTST